MGWGNLTVGKLGEGLSHMLWITLVENANAMMILHTVFTSLCPLPYPLKHNSNYRKPPPSASQKKRMSYKDAEFSLLSASYHMRVWKPHTTCPAWNGRSLPYGRSLFKVMSVLLLVTKFSIYLFKIPTTLNWIPSYFLINKVFHFLKSFCKCTCMFYKVLIIKYFLFTVNYFKQLKR